MYVSEQNRGKCKTIHIEYSYSHNLCGFASVSSDKIKSELILCRGEQDRTGWTGATWHKEYRKKNAGNKRVIIFQSFIVEVLPVETFSVPYHEYNLSFCKNSGLITVSCY